jgi:hypothetical protein
MKTKLPKERFTRRGEDRAEEKAKLPIKYLDADDVSRIYSISYGRLRPILKRHPELSITLVDPGRSRGKRLIIVAKLEAYLANQPTGFAKEVAQ